MRNILITYLLCVVFLLGFMVYNANKVRVCYIPAMQELDDISYRLNAQQQDKKKMCTLSFGVIFELHDCVTNALPQKGFLQSLTPFIKKLTMILRIFSKDEKTMILNHNATCQEYSELLFDETDSPFPQ